MVVLVLNKNQMKNATGKNTPTLAECLYIQWAVFQGQSINLIEAAKESKVVFSVLREERNDQTVWSELFERAKELAAGCEIEPSVPRISAIQHNRANHSSSYTTAVLVLHSSITPQQYWYRALYLPLVDHLIQELR